MAGKGVRDVRVARVRDLGRQMNETLRARPSGGGSWETALTSSSGTTGATRSSKADQGKTVGEAAPRAGGCSFRSSPGMCCCWANAGERCCIHPPGSKVPKKYHLYITFEDGSFLTVTTQMWGAMELYEEGEEQERQYVKDMSDNAGRARVHLRLLLCPHG